jgi:hypothetical protein
MSALSQSNDLGLEKVVSWTIQHDEVSKLLGLGERTLVERIYCYVTFLVGYTMAKWLQLRYVPLIPR